MGLKTFSRVIGKEDTEQLKERKIPGKRAIGSILENELTSEDYGVIERGLKIYDWNDVSSVMVSKDARYKTIANKNKFLKIEKSIGKIEKEYGSKDKITFIVLSEIR